MGHAQSGSERAERTRPLAYLLASVALAAAGLFPIDNPDTYGHLAQGRQIVALGHVPTHDTLSFFRAEPQPWHNYEWLSDLATYELYARGGATALLAGKCLLLVLSALLLLRLAETLGGVRALSIGCVLLIAAIPAARFRLTERPHLLALPFSALYFLGFAQLLRGTPDAKPQRDRAWIAALAVLHLAWVNLHGSHLLGLALTLIACACAFSDRDARKRLLAVLALQVAVSCVSPYGPAILTDAIEHVVNPVYRELVSEWDAWKASDPLWILLAPIAASLALAWCTGPLLQAGRATRTLLFCACLLGVASFRSIRFVGEFLLLGAPVLAIGLAQRSEHVAWPSLQRALGAALAACVVLVPWGAAQLPPHLPLAAGESTLRLPASAGRWLARHARAPRVLASIEDSWYLMFAVPQARFLIDGRVPFYGPSHVMRFQRALQSPQDLTTMLDEFRVDSVVVRHTYAAHRTLLRTLRGDARFRLVSIEDRYATFVREGLALHEGGAAHTLALEPSYDVAWLFDADATRRRAIAAELSRLPNDESSRGYRGYVRAMLSLAPLLRPGHAAGLPAPSSADETRVLRSAQAALERASRGAEGVPIIDAYHALVSIALCDLDAAEHALSLATREGDSRETLLGLQELRLRRGEADAVRSFLAQADAHGGPVQDAWLSALRDALQHPPRCQ